MKYTQALFVFMLVFNNAKNTDSFIERIILKEVYIMNIWYKNGKIIELEKDSKVVYSGPIIFTFKGFRDIEKAKDDICNELDRWCEVVYTKDTDSIYVRDTAFATYDILNSIEERFGYSVKQQIEDCKIVYQVLSKRYQKGILRVSNVKLYERAMA